MSTSLLSLGFEISCGAFFEISTYNWLSDVFLGSDWLMRAQLIPNPTVIDLTRNFSLKKSQSELTWARPITIEHLIYSPGNRPQPDESLRV